MGGGTPLTPEKKKKISPANFLKLFKIVVEWGHLQVIKDVIIPLGEKPLEARGETSSIIIIDIGYTWIY